MAAEYRVVSDTPNLFCGRRKATADLLVKCAPVAGAGTSCGALAKIGSHPLLFLTFLFAFCGTRFLNTLVLPYLGNFGKRGVYVNISWNVKCLDFDRLLGHNLAGGGGSAPNTTRGRRVGGRRVAVGKTVTPRSVLTSREDVDYVPPVLRV